VPPDHVVFGPKPKVQLRAIRGAGAGAGAGGDADPLVFGTFPSV
jgi:hypothetical protein